MRKLFLFMMVATILVSCGDKSGSNNPLLQEFTNEFEAPPFDKIKDSHYLPAFEVAMEAHQAEIDSIANNPEEPTFENTIEAMEYSGQLLTRVRSIFSNVRSADTNEELNKVAQEVFPKLTAHSDNIYLNDALFQRVKTLVDKKEELELNPEQDRVLDKIYKRFVRSGADLNEEQKAELREINKRLSTLELTFGQNVLAETNAYQKFVTDEADLAGLSEGMISAAAEGAKEAGKEGQWLFTTQKSSFIPVLQYSENRALREELLMAYNDRCNQGNEYDNKEIIKELMKLRVQRANLLGFDSPAAFILDNTMAKTPENVYNFLDKIWTAALKKGKQEAAELQALMDAEGKGEKLEPWDWWYYAEKLRKEKYDLDEEEVRPYFKLENVRQGVFEVTNKLYGLSYEKLENIPVYNEEVEVFKVTDADGSHIGLLFTDYFPRPGKNVGAWMSSYKHQYKKDGVNHRPIIVNVGNFTRPTGDKPSLLTMDEVETLFHEFGHALHGLLTQATYPSLSGTSVLRDFVELPSQVMENWAFEPEVLKSYAFHYETGEVIPDELIEKIEKVSTFNQGFRYVELTSASLLDMDFHSMTTTDDFDVMEFEKKTMERIGTMPEIIVRYRAPFFKHVFEGGYSAGYYGYTWAEVLDADAFAAFVETGDIFNPEVAKAFRTNVLEKGDTEDPMVLYRTFRGKDATPEALLKKRGLN